MAKIHEITVKAPINIALIKYWGKRNEKLILPLNDSISVSIDELFATTRIYIGSHIEENSITVNGKKLDQGHMQRFEMVFQECEKLVYRRKRQAVEDFAWTNWHMEIDSRTNFPTSAGLASSAAGFAAIAFGIGQIFGFDEKDIVRLARIGSGSACRSIQSGFVHWRAGFLDKDDSDCICETIDPVKNWPELRAMIFVVSQDQKKMGSTEAMRNSVNSSELLAHRAQDIVPRRVEKLKQAIIAKDFARLAQVTMAESNQLHAICLDTMPPVNYLNATSHDLMEFVHAFNSTFGTRLAYTFDAGPNCCLLLEEETIPLLALAFKHCFTFECQFPAVEDSQNTDEEMRAKIVGIPWPSSRQIQIERIIVSKVGGGPAVLGSCSSPNIPNIV